MDSQHRLGTRKAHSVRSWLLSLPPRPRRYSLIPLPSCNGTASAFCDLPKVVLRVRSVRIAATVFGCIRPLSRLVFVGPFSRAIFSRLEPFYVIPRSPFGVYADRTLGRHRH